MKLYVSIPALLAVGLLSACGSSSTPVNQIEDAIGFAAAIGDIQAVNVEDLPDNATMNGYLAASNDYANGTGTVFVGDATADFNFANSTLKGTASNFNAYELGAACADGFDGCTGEKTRALGGSLNIIGDINGTDFDYDATGQLTSEDDDLGTLTANVYLNGNGQIGTVDDKLTAVGYGGGSADVFDEDGLLTSGELGSLLVLQE